VVHNTALNSSDNLPSYPSNNHHSSDDVYRSLQRGDSAEQYMISQFHEIRSSKSASSFDLAVSAAE